MRGVKITTIATTHSDGSRPAVPIDRDPTGRMVCEAFQALVYAAQQRLCAGVDAALRYDRNRRMAHVYA